MKFNIFKGSVITLPQIFNEDSDDFDTAISSAKSKCIEKGIDVDTEPFNFLDPHILVLVIKENNTRISYWDNNIFSFVVSGVVGNIGDGFLLLNSTNYTITHGKIDTYKFRIVNKKNYGNGEKIYRAEIIFSDKYYLDVLANNKEEALNIAYSIGMEEWVHEWPEDKELDRWQSTRKSKWGKKMIKVVEKNA
jgi:hypothetical protein